MSTPPEYAHFPTITAFEEYANRDWIHPCGSDTAQHHTYKKLAEETHELIEAISSGKPEEIVGESADVLWIARATLTSATGDLSSLHHSLKQVRPDDFSTETIQVAEVNRVALEHFARFNPHEIQQSLEWYTASLGETALLLFTNKAQGADISQQETLLNGGQADLAHITFLISYALQQYADVGLHEAMNNHQQKIAGRKRDGAAITRPVLNGTPIPLPDTTKILHL